MVQLELNAPFAEPPTLSVSFSAGGGPQQSVSVRLPVMPHRFCSPWQMSKDEYAEMTSTRLYLRGRGLQSLSARCT